jgi:hypothetical protein
MSKPLALFLSVIIGGGFVRPAASEEVPLKGQYAGQAVDAAPVEGGFFVTTVGGGTLTHLGKIAFISPHFSGFDFSVAGEQILTAADGDTFTGQFDGQLTPTPDGAFLVGDLEVTIVAGTGRFSGATGSYTFSIIFEFATLKSVATIEGTIDYGEE